MSTKTKPSHYFGDDADSRAIIVHCRKKKDDWSYYGYNVHSEKCKFCGANLFITRTTTLSIDGKILDEY